MIFLLLDTNQKKNAKILSKASSNIKAKSDDKNIIKDLGGD